LSQERICELLPKGSLATYVVSDYLHDVGPAPGLSWMPFRTRKGPPCSVVHKRYGRYPIIGSLASLATDLLVAIPRLPAIIEDIVAFGRKHAIEAVWCPLQGQTMIRLALPVAEQLQVPLLTQVWDPPTWWLREHRLHPYSQRRILHQFGLTISASARFGAASEPMAQEYTTKYNARAVPLLPFLPDEYHVQAAKAKAEGDRFRIGIAGQLYAQTEWQALFQALDRVGWKIRGKQVTVGYLGSYPLQHGHANAYIERLGSRPQQKCIRILSSFDVLYCPYWFDRTFETEARLSFPSKLVTYLAAGRPVFFHGPEYASAVPLMRYNDIGRCCHSLDPEAILQSLEQVLLDPGLWTRLSKNVQRTFFDFFSLTAQKPYLARFFDLPETRLSTAS
jgi:hypothetical protein